MCRLIYIIGWMDPNDGGLRKTIDHSTCSGLFSVLLQK
jgi:hypothetical protein